MKIKKYLTQTENENNYTVANAHSQDLNIKSLGLNFNSFISDVAFSQSDFMALLAFCATQIASSTWEQQKSLGAFGVYSKQWIMRNLLTDLPSYTWRASTSKSLKVAKIV